MIKANELRIGNWVIDQDGDISQLDSGEYIDLYHEEFKSIPLTPEILERCGFIKKYTIEYKNEHIQLAKEGNGFVMFTAGKGDAESEESRILNYLHELQNLHYDWSGEELNVQL